MIAIISDIHGNYPALEAVLSEIDKFKCSKIISLGDVAGYYPFINECIDTLRNRKVINIQGNHDFYLTNNIPCPRSESANSCLDLQRKLITHNNLEWLKNSVLNLELDNMYFVHGGLNNTTDEYLYQISEDYLAQNKKEILFCGHAHVQKVLKFSNKTFCNPGSVGQPRDGNPKAAFAVIKNNKIELKRVSYNIDETVEAMKYRNFPSHFYENLYKGTRIGGKIDSIDKV